MFFDKLQAAATMEPRREWAGDGADGWVNTSAGEFVDGDTAMKLSAVFACIRLISDDVKVLPVGVFRREKNRRVRMDGHPVDDLISWRPNDDMDIHSFRQAMQTSTDLKGNSYAEIQRNGYGHPVALWPLDADKMDVKLEAGRVVYDYRDGIAGKRIPVDRVFHVKGMTLDGYIGLSVLRYAMETFGAGLAIAKTRNSLFANGLRPSAVVTAAGQMDETVRGSYKKDFTELYNGSNNTGKVVVLDQGMKLEKWSITPEEAQFLETGQVNIQDICRWFGVKQYKLGIQDRETHSNIFQNALEHWQECILPRTTMWEAEVERKLFSLAEKKQQFYTKHNYGSLLRVSPAERANFYSKMFQLGWSINEIRELEDKDPIGADGDRRFVSQNVKSLEEALQAAGVNGNTGEV